MLGKKGMSPIIATILLIAFAVSLGAMIMNFGEDLVPAGEKESICNSLKVRMNNFCYQENGIKMSVTNTGDKNIAGLVVEISTPDADQSIAVKESSMEPGEQIVKSVRTLRPENFEIMIFPKIVIEDETFTCENSIQTLTELPAC